LSLNWREIDRLLAELPLAGSIVRQIYQPRHPVLVLELYQRGSTFRLLFSFAAPHLRLHLSSARPANPSPAPRFVAFLRSRIRDGRLLAAAQVGRERIVRLEVEHGGERLLLWARLWGGAANLIATDPQGTVLDALYRRPRRGEVSGGRFEPPPEASAAEDRGRGERFQAREFPGEGSYNQRVERYYEQLERDEERLRLRASVRNRLQRRESRLLAGLEGLRERQAEQGGYAQLQRWGRLILANAHAIQAGARWLETEDFEEPGTRVSIELDPRATPAQNAEDYFRRYRKARSALERLTEDLQIHERDLAAVQRELAALEAEQDLEVLRSRLAALDEKKAASERAGQKTPGLEFSSGTFRLLVGRSAAENDELLRRHVRGNDTWVHSRDSPGAYVFIRTPAGKSVPLDTLLDAANLALHYSKARSSGKGDVYYTRVKYLRRAREGPPGLVLPTQEKNLRVRLDPQRLARLLGSY
jgi:predicted ribosome quality control (RQC) complex YloA/Tae2 family protein